MNALKTLGLLSVLLMGGIVHADEPTYNWDDVVYMDDSNPKAPAEYGSGNFYLQKEAYKKKHPEKFKLEFTIGSLVNIIDLVQKKIVAALEKERSKELWETSDRTLAQCIISNQKALLTNWQTSMDVFHEVVLREDKSALKANYGKVFQEYFIKKIVGLLVEAVPPGYKEAVKLIVDPDMIKDLLEERERAKASVVKLSISEFYVEQKDFVADVLTQMVLGERKFLDEIEKRMKNKDLALAQHSDLVLSCDSMERQLKFATRGKLFLDQVGLFVSESRYNDERAFIRVMLNENLSFREARIYAPKAEQMATQVNKYFPSGFDIRLIAEAPVKVSRAKSNTSFPKGFVFFEDGLIRPYKGAPESGALEKAIRDGKVPKIRLKEENP